MHIPCLPSKASHLVSLQHTTDAPSDSHPVAPLFDSVGDSSHELRSSHVPVDLVLAGCTGILSVVPSGNVSSKGAESVYGTGWFFVKKGRCSPPWQLPPSTALKRRLEDGLIGIDPVNTNRMRKTRIIIFVDFDLVFGTPSCWVSFCHTESHYEDAVRRVIS